MTRDQIIKRLVDRYLELKKKKFDPRVGEGEEQAGATGDDEISDMLELLANLEEKVITTAMMATGRCEHDNWKGECLRCVQEAKEAKEEQKKHRPRK